jgi:hypothetical protein
MSKNQKLADIIIFFFSILIFLAQAEAKKYLILPQLDITPCGRSKFCRIDNKKGLLKQDTINQSIDVTNNAN